MIEVAAIVGPTASGKSAIADAVAFALDTAVVSADAMQVYRGMDIGTAKLGPGESRAPLLLIDIVDPGVAYSAALYQRDARRACDGLIRRGLVPIVCGGTGLYVRAALDEFDFPAGQLDSEQRDRYDTLAEELGADGLYALLERRDPESASVIHPHNVRRVIRALEMCDDGQSYARQKAGFTVPRPHYRTAYFGLSMDRERLYRRINERVDQMMEQGLVEEVKRLVSDGLGTTLTARQAIGYKEIIDALQGRCSMQEAVDTIKRRSRRYAKRQISWFKRDERIRWLDMDALSSDEAAARIINTVNAERC